MNSSLNGQKFLKAVDWNIKNDALSSKNLPQIVPFMK